MSKIQTYKNNENFSAQPRKEWCKTIKHPWCFVYLLCSSTHSISFHNPSYVWLLKDCSAATSKSFGTFFPFQIILRFGKRKQCKISWMRWRVYALKHQILQTIYQLASPVNRCIVLQKENIFPELPCCFFFQCFLWSAKQFSLLFCINYLALQKSSK